MIVSITFFLFFVCIFKARKHSFKISFIEVWKKMFLLLNVLTAGIAAMLMNELCAFLCCTTTLMRGKFGKHKLWARRADIPISLFHHIPLYEMHRLYEAYHYSVCCLLQCDVRSSVATSCMSLASSYHHPMSTIICEGTIPVCLFLSSFLFIVSYMGMCDRSQIRLLSYDQVFHLHSHHCIVVQIKQDLIWPLG